MRGFAQPAQPHARDPAVLGQLPTTPALSGAESGFFVGTVVSGLSAVVVQDVAGHHHRAVTDVPVDGGIRVCLAGVAEVCPSSSTRLHVGNA
ncbi:hypothetical protein AB0H12_35300 [Actinosynnema sp. NPDC023794]